MKNNLFLYVLFIVLAACSKDNDKFQLSTNEREFNIDNTGTTLRFGIESSSDWNIDNHNTWYTATKVTHDNGDSLVITVQTNIARQKRSGEMTLSNKDKRLSLAINQAAATEEYHFKLPIIFHVLYKDASDPYQNIPAWYLQQVLDDVNAYYNGTINRNPGFNPVDMNVEFTLATHDPSGALLKEPGIHRILRNNITLDCQKFLENEYDDAKWLWDQNKYINVVIFNFTEQNTAGISFMAYTPSTYPLEGLPSGDAYFTNPPTKQAHCIALNNVTAGIGIYLPTQEVQDRMSQSLAHELGHYLGLFHAFSKDSKVETDYCADTPDYNRAAYEQWLNTIPSFILTEAYQRNSRNGNTFTSTNTMDYFYGWLNLFTDDQRARIRHVLEYSPLVPGPKIPSNLTRGTGITEPGIIMK